MATTASATLVVAVALLIASVALVLVLRQQLTDSQATLAQQQNATVSALIASDGFDDVDQSDLDTALGEGALAQITTSGGRPILSSRAVENGQILSSMGPDVGDTKTEEVDELNDDSDPYVLVASSLRTEEGTVTIVTAQSLESVALSTTILITALAIGAPLLLIVVALTAYWLVGRALRPVEDIRQRVAQVSAANQGAQVPVPNSGDEIARLAQTMNSMLSRLAAAAAAQHRFVADASHELRTPLATIKATTELAGSHPEAMDVATARHTVLTETARLERLVGDLLLLARADENGLVMQVTDVDLDDIVTSEGTRIRHINGVAVRLDIRSARVQGDPQHLLRAVRNLLDNAARHASTSVTIGLAVSEGNAVLDVLDDGPGVPQAEHERVFERFVRLDESRERGSGGTGLGLSITAQIAAAHGGVVQLLPYRSDQGAHFRLILPVSAA